MLVEVCSCYLSLERGGIMLKETLLNIVDLNFDKKLNNIGVFGQNITTRALEIYNEFKKNSKI